MLDATSKISVRNVKIGEQTCLNSAIQLSAPCLLDMQKSIVMPSYPQTAQHPAGGREKGGHFNKYWENYGTNAYLLFRGRFQRQPSSRLDSNNALNAVTTEAGPKNYASADLQRLLSLGLASWLLLWTHTAAIVSVDECRKWAQHYLKVVVVRRQ
jgi:hypothetical protein